MDNLNRDSQLPVEVDRLEEESPAPIPLTPRSTWWTLGLSFGIGLAVIVSQLIAVAIYLVVEIAGDPKFNIEKWAATADRNGNVWNVGMWSAAFVAVPLIWVAAWWVSRGAAADFLRLRWPTFRQFAGWMLAIAALMAFSDLLAWSVGGEIVPPVMKEVYRTAGSPALLWLTIVVAAPVVEELFFRGLLFEGLVRSRLGVAGAALSTSLLWAVIHTQYDAAVVVQIFVVGLLLAAARLTTQSVILCMLMHAFLNLVATLQLVYALRA